MRLASPERGVALKTLTVSAPGLGSGSNEPAGAQAAEVWPIPAPVLKRTATVTDDIVRVGDLIEHAGTIAEIAIFRAPDLGETGSVPASRIAEAVRGHGLYGLDIAGIPDV